VNAEHPNVAAVRAALLAGGADPARVARLQVLPGEVRTAAAAAEALGVEVGQIANSLVFDAGGTPLLVLTSGAHRVDTGKVAAALGVAAVGRATPEFVRAATGQAIGGGAPGGPPAPAGTRGARARAGPQGVGAAGGTPPAGSPTPFGELVAAPGGPPADVA